MPSAIATSADARSRRAASRDDSPAASPARRILHVLAPGTIGGVGTVVLHLSTAQRAAGHDARVALFLGASGHPVAAALEEAGITVYPLVAPPRAYLRQRRLLAACCRDVRPDVVHTHGYHADVLGAQVVRALGIPTTTTLHGFTGGDRKNRLYEVLQRWAARRSGAAVAVSRPLADLLARSGVPRSRLHVVPNAIAPASSPLDRAAARAALGVPGDGFRIGWVGRLSAEKGPDLMLRALSALGEPAVMLSVLGDGPDITSLRTLAARLGVASQVRFHGPVPGASRLLRAFDAVVLSSRTEGTPMVMLEAMAAAVPVVATAVGGVPDLAGGTASLVPPEDPDALAAALRALVDAPARRARLGESGARRVAADYATEPWVRRYDAVYSSIAPARPPFR